MIDTPIQWCHSSANPIMGCPGCELFPAPAQILQALDQALAQITDWSPGASRALFSRLIQQAFAKVPNPQSGHRGAVTTTNIWHLRQNFISEMQRRHGAQAAVAAESIIGQHITCYAAKLHLNKAQSIAAPHRLPNSGYAPSFEQVTRFSGRMMVVANLKDLRGTRTPGKPWLNGLPRLVFISDMGDAFARKSDLAFLRNEVMSAITSPNGQRHFWLWLTKRPQRMAEFANSLGGFPPNVCAMTTITGPETLHRLKALRTVSAHIRALSIEPLLARLPPESIDLGGIDWMILGGESGRLDHVRPFQLEWARELRDLCFRKKVAFFLKQIGRYPTEGGKSLKLHDKHGGDWNEWPTDLWVRQMPDQFR